MTSVQIHLALTHVPVILSIVGVIMLATALILKNATLKKTSYYIILIAGLAVIPVYLSGEGAEETAEHLAGVSESMIERHEEVAKMSLNAILAAGVLALGALIAQRWNSISRMAGFAVLLVAIVSAGLTAQTAHLGGQIRHTEINDIGMAQNEGGPADNGDQQEEDD